MASGSSYRPAERRGGGLPNPDSRGEGQPHVPPSDPLDLVVFRLDELRFALPLVAVERVFRAVEVSPLPGAPPIVLGVVDIHGRVLPVLNIRRRFLGRDRALAPADSFVLAHTARQPVVLVVDGTDGVIRGYAHTVRSVPPIAAGEPIAGIVRLDDGLVVIYDLESFLSAADLRALTEAMARPPADHVHTANPVDRSHH